MKKLTTILCISFGIAIALLSCKKDSETGPSLVGKWNAQTSILTVYTNDIKTSSDTTVYNVNNQLLIEFTAGNTATITTIKNGQQNSNEYTYKTNGNKLIVSTGNDTIDNNTFTLTDNEFILKETTEKIINGDKIREENVTSYKRMN